MENCGKEYDVIVVGAGVMGSSVAYQLAKRGQNTLLLEQFDLLHHRGSSHGESRTLRFTYPEDYYTSLVLESSKLWEEAQAEMGCKVYYKTRHLDIGASEDATFRALVRNCESLRVPHRVLDPNQVADEFSGRVRLPENWVGVVTQGGVLKATKAVSMFQTLALKNGATLRDNTEVKNIAPDGARGGGVWVSVTSGERFWAKKCVVTAGAWTTKLLRSVTGMELPIQPLETMLCYWRIKEGHEHNYGIEADFPTFAKYGDPYIYGTPSLEYPGLIKVAVHGGIPCDPDKRPWGPGLPLHSLQQWIQTTFSGAVDATEPVATQLCMYSITPDDDYVIDFLGGHFGEDVVIAGGFSGHGFKMAPVAGRILADLLLTGKANDVDLHYFSLARFAANTKGNVKPF